MRFLIIVTGWNCRPFIRKCYESLLGQTHAAWQAVFVLDGATDGSALELCETLKDSRCRFRIHKENQGAARRRYEALKEFGQPTDIVLLLGMDDELLPNCLERVAEEYRAGKWMTYGNWIDQHGKGLPADFELDFPEEVHANRSYRTQTFRSTAPNTFYKFLFDRIPVEDFQIAGKWIDSTTESEVMFSCMEMCGRERIGIIREPIYLYNRNLPNGTLKRQGSNYKYQILKTIMERKKKDQLSDEQFGKSNDEGKAKAKANGTPKKKPAADPKLNDRSDNNSPWPEQDEPINLCSGDTAQPPSEWEQKMQNLRDRRSTGQFDNQKVDPIIADYGRHLRASEKHGTGIGARVLDVGAGAAKLRGVVERHSQYSGREHEYLGIDAFPAADGVLPMKIEDCCFDDQEFDTTCCFATLDGVEDLGTAVEQIKRVTNKNVIFLTGIGIEPDQYHTHKIEEQQLIDLMGEGWAVTLKNYLQPKVLLIEFTRKG